MYIKSLLDIWRTIFQLYNISKSKISENFLRIPSLVVSADCRRVRMVWRKMNGANVVLIYPRPVISGLSQCRLPPFKNTVFVPIQSVLTKKPGDYRLRYIKTILSFQNSVTYGEVTTRDCLIWGNIRIQSF